MSTTPLRLRELLERLIEAEVQFILVGGLAVNAWGYLRATRDVDVVPDPDRENLAKLDALLRALGGRVDVGGRLLDSDAISIAPATETTWKRLKLPKIKARARIDPGRRYPFATRIARLGSYERCPSRVP